MFDGDTRLIHHSDRGSQYVSIAYTQRLLDAGIEPSVGSVGDSTIMLWRQCFGGNHQRPDIIHSYRAEAVLPPSFGTGKGHGSHVKRSNGQPFNGSNSSMDPGVQHKRLFETTSIIFTTNLASRNGPREKRVRLWRCKNDHGPSCQ